MRTRQITIALVLLCGCLTLPFLGLIPTIAATADQSPPKTAPAAQAAEESSEITNSIGMKLRLIRAGNFLMGAPDSDRNCPPYERPQHRVRIKRPFYFGKYEVTRGEFRKFVDATGYKTIATTNGGMGYVCVQNECSFAYNFQYSWKNTGFEQTDQHPVVNVTCSDALKFCEWLSQKEGKKYRLPTEAEWEWSCRAGTIERFQFGDAHETLQGKINLADKSLEKKKTRTPHVNWDDGFPFTAPVGSFKPNPFGLYDMHGNVREWCSDWFDPNDKYYARSPINDPRGPATGSSGVSRGGSWMLRPAACRSASRLWLSRELPYIDLGFRVVCEQSEK